MSIKTPPEMLLTCVCTFLDNSSAMNGAYCFGAYCFCGTRSGESVSASRTLACVFGRLKIAGDKDRDSSVKEPCSPAVEKFPARPHFFAAALSKLSCSQSPAAALRPAQQRAKLASQSVCTQPMARVGCSFNFLLFQGEIPIRDRGKKCRDGFSG